MAFSENIIYYKCVNSLTREELAERSGINAGALKRMEEGKAFPYDMSYVEKIAEALNVKADDLFDYTDFLVMKAGKKSGLKRQRALRCIFDKTLDHINNTVPEMPEDDKRAFLSALDSAYWRSVEEAKKRYTPKKYRKPELTQQPD